MDGHGNGYGLRTHVRADAARRAAERETAQNEARGRIMARVAAAARTERPDCDCGEPAGYHTKDCLIFV